MEIPVRRQLVAAELKRIRESIGASGEEVAAALGWSQSKISRVENARIAISVRDLATLLHYYGASEEVRAELLAATAEDAGYPGAWVVQAGGPRRRQTEVASIETRVTSIRQYYPLMIPGQLQSPDYALAFTRLGGWPDPESIVARRMKRQELLGSAHSPRYTALLEARGFLSWPGGRDVMMGQIDFIRVRAQQRNISIQVIPLREDRLAAAIIPFTLYEFASGSQPSVVFVETQTADLYLSAQPDIDTYEDIFGKLTSEALDEETSLDYLAELVSHVEDVVHRRWD
ncbi:helix-turn-helix domain-containing protein [Micromonospora fulviviridis]|uniref:Helix-turn-helix transcriptional regulator n=1 Tax=Micromonospora fulviviridis TaxID=47860 RepID=A0ABV2VVN3_9ACTN